MADTTTDLAVLDTQMRTWRRHLHQNPEFGFEERETARFVVERLKSFGITDIVEGVGGTGVVATLKRGAGKRIIALRADMDALRISEHTNAPYASRTPGLMHACGHDGHTTMLLGAAQLLATDCGFDGVVRFVFQPAEEWGQGMKAMLRDGLGTLLPFDEIYGLHNKPGLDVGRFATRPGAFMAAEDNFEIKVRGSGGHASRPHECRDAIVCACAIVMELQTVVARAVDPAELAVVSVTELHSDGTRNAIAAEARIDGDCRHFDPSVSATIEAAMRRIVAGVAAAHGCEAEMSYTRVFVPSESRARDPGAEGKTATGNAHQSTTADGRRRRRVVGSIAERAMRPSSTRSDVANLNIKRLLPRSEVEHQLLEGR